MSIERIRKLRRQGYTTVCIARELGMEETEVRSIIAASKRKRETMVDPTPEEIAERAREVRSGWGRLADDAD